jgi:hypothetical protein
MNFLGYYFKTFTKPTSTFEALLSDNRRFKFGFFFMLVQLIGYTLMYIFLAIAEGAPSVFTPWLNIPKESYYSVNQFLLAPSLIMSWFMSVSFIQILSRIFGGKGSWEDTLSVIGLCIGVAMWGTLVHDLAMSFSSAVGFIDAKEHEIAMNSPTIWRTLLWISVGIYTIAFLILFTKAIRAVHKLSSVKAAIIGFIGFLVFQLVIVIFNR